MDLNWFSFPVLLRVFLFNFTDTVPRSIFSPLVKEIQLEKKILMTIINKVYFYLQAASDLYYWGSAGGPRTLD